MATRSGLSPGTGPPVIRTVPAATSTSTPVTPGSLLISVKLAGQPPVKTFHYSGGTGPLGTYGGAQEGLVPADDARAVAPRRRLLLGALDWDHLGAARAPVGRSVCRTRAVALCLDQHPAGAVLMGAGQDRSLGISSHEPHLSSLTIHSVIAKLYARTGQPRRES